jgi:hypothetical protein
VVQAEAARADAHSVKRIAVFLALFALGLAAASTAVAKPPPPGKETGKGKNGKHEQTTSTEPSTDPESCDPKVSVILKGTFVSGNGGSFTIDVKSANSHGRAYAGKPLRLTVDSKTSFKRNGPARLADFKAGDRLNVQARACKAKKSASSSSAAAPDLLAKRVVGLPAKAAGSDGDGDD